LRKIDERWWNVGFHVEFEQVTQPSGGNGSGAPETIEVAILILQRKTADGIHILRIPFDPESKRKLIEGLSRGIVIPPHLPFGGGV